MKKLQSELQGSTDGIPTALLLQVGLTDIPKPWLVALALHRCCAFPSWIPPRVFFSNSSAVLQAEPS